MPKEVQLNVNGEHYNVRISYPTEAAQDNTAVAKTSEKGKKVGDQITEGETVAYIEAMKVINAITADMSGTIAEIMINHGDDIDEDDQIFKIV